MNTARKGRRFEYKTRKLLERVGYVCTRSAASKGHWDIIALGSPGTVRLVQVKVNKTASLAEREELQMLASKFNQFSVELWTWKDRVKEPIIEVF